MQGTEWIYSLVDKITEPLKNIEKQLGVTGINAQWVEDHLGTIGDSAPKIHGVSGAFQELGGTILGVAGGLTAYNLAAQGVQKVTETIREQIHEVFDVREEMERYTTVLTNSYGSASKAAGALQMLEDYTKTAPVHINELVDSFITLREKGFTPTFQQLTAIGDVAAAGNKPLTDLLNSIEMAGLGATRGLKQFGIQLKPVPGDLEHLTAKFQGHKTVIGNTEEAIRNYVTAIGQMNGIHGTAANIMAGLTGEEYELTDVTHKLHETLGDVFGTAMAEWLHFKIEAVEGLTHAVEWLSAHRSEIADFFKTLAVGIGVAAGLWGIYQAAQIGAYLWMMRSVVAEALLADWTVILGNAMEFLNAVMYANPIGIIIGLIAALAAIIYYAWNHSEAFRSTITGLWEAIKTLGEGMWDIATTVFKGWIEFWKGLGEIIIGALTLDWGQIKTGMSDVGKGLEDTYVKPFQKAYDLASKTGDAYAAGRAKGSAAFQQHQKDSETADSGSVVTPANALNAGGNGTSTSADGGSGGGSGAGRNIKVTINQLVGKIEIHAGNVAEGIQQIERQISEKLIAEIRDFEVGISNG